MRQSVKLLPAGGDHAHQIHSRVSQSRKCSRGPDVGRRAGPSRVARRPGVLDRGRHDGRRAGQRQEGRLDHHHDRREQRQGTVQLPGRQVGAGALQPHHSRRGLHPDGSEGGGCDCQRSDGRPQARQDEEHRRPALQCGMAPQRSGRRQDQVVPARLRRLPHAAARVHLAAQRRRMEERLYPDGPLCTGKRAGAAAIAGERRRAQRAPARCRQHDAAGGGFFGQRQPEQSGPRGIYVPDPAAPEGPRHARDHHRIRPAAKGSAAARCRHRSGWPRLVFRLRQRDGRRA